MLSLKGEQRKKKILEILEEEGSVKAKHLSLVLKVSTETIRRYLDELEREGKLKKVYGGAIATFFHKVEPSSIEREIIHAQAKKIIGKKAASLIKHNEVIAIDDGSTTLQLVKYLKDKKNLTILTNSIPALSILMEAHYQQLFTGKIMCLGGEVNSSHQRTSGSITEQMLENWYIDKAFISCDGLTLERGITCYDSNKGILSQKLISHASTSIVVADHSKIGLKNQYKIADFKQIDMIITNEPYPDEWKPTILNNSLIWLIAKEE